MDNNAVLQTIINRFPDLSDQITKQFNDCESFLEICEDYVLCLNSIRKIESSDLKKDQNLGDFKDALKKLEEELMARLSNRLSIKNPN